MASESIAHEASEAMRARGIIVLVKSNYLVKYIETKKPKLVKKSFLAANKSALFATSRL